MKFAAALFLGLIACTVGYPMFTDERSQIQANGPFCQSCKEKYCRIIPNFCASKGCACITDPVFAAAEQADKPFCRSCKEKYCLFVPNFCASKGCSCPGAGPGPGPVPTDNPQAMAERGQIQKSTDGCRLCGSDIGFCFAYEWECNNLCGIPCLFLGTPIEYPVPVGEGQPQP